MGHYILLDTMGIQKSIFETNRQKIILGASLQLAKWEKQCADDAKGKGSWVNSAGGNILAYFDDENSKESATKFARTWCEDAAEMGFEVAWAVAEGVLPEKKNIKEDIDTWNNLQEEICKYKAGARCADDYFTAEILSRQRHIDAGGKVCQECGIRAYTHNIEIWNDGKLVETRQGCKVCFDRYNMRPNKVDYADTSIGALCYNLNFVEELCELAGLEDEKDKEDAKPIAILSLDLNGMGKYFQDIISDGGFAKYKDASGSIEQDFHNAFKDTIEKICPKKDNEKTPCRLLLLAGDDALIALKQEHWIRFTMEILKRIKDKHFGQTASAGVIIGAYNYPFNHHVKMANELVTNAKSQFRYLDQKKQKENKRFDDCVLDWHMFQESAFTSALDARQRGWVRYKDDSKRIVFVPTNRPYTLVEFKKLLNDAPRYWGCLHKTQSKLYSLYKAVRTSPEETRDTLVYEFLRNEKQDLTKYKGVWDFVLENTPKDQEGAPMWRHESADKEQYITEAADSLELYMMTKEGKSNG